MSNFNQLLAEALDEMEIEDLVFASIKDPDNMEPIKRLKQIASENPHKEKELKRIMQKCAEKHGDKPVVKKVLYKITKAMGGYFAKSLAAMFRELMNRSR